MMAWTRPSTLVFVFVLGLAFILLALGYFMPELRRALVFAPTQAGAQAAVARIAAGEKSVYQRTGSFVAFSVAEAPGRAKVLDLDWKTMPTGDFQLDAALLPDKNLRLRAIPRGAAVSGLRTPAQIYAAELTPSGALVRQGWLP